MIKQLSIVLCLFSVLFLVGCYSSETSPSTFSVKYYATLTSSGGDRILDIIYTVTDSKITSCEGTYSYPPSSDQRADGNYDNNIESCDVNKLDEYNVPHNFPTVSTVKTGSESDGQSRYEWEIL